MISNFFNIYEAIFLTGAKKMREIVTMMRIVKVNWFVATTIVWIPEVHMATMMLRMTVAKESAPLPILVKRVRVTVKRIQIVLIHSFFVVIMYVVTQIIFHKINFISTICLIHLVTLIIVVTSNAGQQHNAIQMLLVVIVMRIVRMVSTAT